jgi:alpha-tubulin suppressor-like RCC1 family protein
MHALRPIIVEGFGGVRMRRVCAASFTAFAIGDGGELFAWGICGYNLFGHGFLRGLSSPKQVEALRGVRLSSITTGGSHAVALTEDGQVYAWANASVEGATLGTMHVSSELLPKPVEALRGVWVGSVAAAGLRSYAVADTGEVWAWGCDSARAPLLGHGEHQNCPLPKPIGSLRGVKVHAVSAGEKHTLAQADDGRVYAWGGGDAARVGALGLGPAVSGSARSVPTPQRIPALQ